MKNYYARNLKNRIEINNQTFQANISNEIKASSSPESFDQDLLPKTTASSAQSFSVSSSAPIRRVNTKKQNLVSIFRKWADKTREKSLDKH